MTGKTGQFARMSVLFAGAQVETEMVDQSVEIAVDWRCSGLIADWGECLCNMAFVEWFVSFAAEHVLGRLCSGIAMNRH